jgi:hypothetical protein
MKGLVPSGRRRPSLPRFRRGRHHSDKPLGPGVCSLWSGGRSDWSVTSGRDPVRTRQVQ